VTVDLVTELLARPQLIVRPLVAQGRMPMMTAASSPNDNTAKALAT
jgi:hypothetical protein